MAIKMHIENLPNGIKIYVSSVHKFGTDGILLADFASPGAKDTACDLGSGCGIIPLFWCTKGAPARIISVEIQQDACDMLAHSVNENRLDDRFDVINADLRKIKEKLPACGCNVVTMNPPYKAAKDGVQSPDPRRRCARHEIECTLDDAAAAASYLLNFGGRFCLCQRPDRLADVFESMRNNGIEPKRLCMVHQRMGKEPSLILCEGRKGGNPGLRITPPLYIEGENGGWSEKMSEIYGEYARADRNCRGEK